MANDKAETQKNGAAAKEKKPRSSPNGMYVSLPDALRARIEKRAAANFRKPAQEIAFIVHEWMKVEEAKAGSPTEK